jgi:hypothetical protein
MVNIAEGLNSFTGPQLAGLLAVGGLFAVVSAVPGGLAVAGMATVGLGLAGLGIGAFIAGMAITGKVADLIGADGSSLKKILVNMAEGLSAFNKVQAGNLAKVAGGMAVLAPAMILLTTGQVISKAGELIGNALDWAGSWFGGDDDGTDQLGKMAESLMQFEKLSGPELSQAAINVEKLGIGMSAWGTIDADDITENVKASAAAMELLEKTLIGGNPKLANLEPVVDFKGILNIEGIEEGAAEIEKIQQALFALPNSTGIEINSSSLADQIADKLMNSEKSIPVTIVNGGDTINNQGAPTAIYNGPGNSQTRDSITIT